MSKERQKQWWKYLTLRTEFLATHPNCQFKGCTSPASDVHHRKGKIGKLLLNRRYWLAVCRPCHCWIEDNKREARKLKYILYSLLLCFLYSTTYADLGYADNDGNLLPDFRVKNTDSVAVKHASWTGHTLLDADCDRTPILAILAASSFTLSGLVSARTDQHCTEALSPNNERGFNADLSVGVILPAQSFSVRKEGDALWGQHSTIQAQSSAASNVQPADAACPQSVKTPTPLVNPKILETPSEIFARVELEYAPWYPVPDFL